MIKNDRHLTKTINNWWETVNNCIQMLTKSNEMIVFYLKTLHFLWHWVRSWEFGMIFDWVNGDKLWWVDVERLIMITFLPSYLTKQAGKLCFQRLYFQKLLRYQNDVAFRKDQRPLLEQYKGYSQKFIVTPYVHNQGRKTPKTWIFHFL